jgi:hypothetical protein
MKCRNCGLCCYLVVVVDGVGRPSDIPCPYLRFKKSGRTFCSIYKNRLGKDIGNGNHCTTRDKSLFDYEGCPNNTNKPLVKDWRKI